MGHARSLISSPTLQVLTHHLSLTKSPVLVTHRMPYLPLTNLDSAWTVIFTVSQSDFQTSCDGKIVILNTIEEHVYSGPYYKNTIYVGVCVLDSLTCADNISDCRSVAGFVSERSVRTLSQSWLRSAAFNLINPGVPVAETILVLVGDPMGSSTVKLSARHRCIIEIPGFTTQRAPLALVKVLHSSHAAIWPTSQLHVACKWSSTCDCLCGGPWCDPNVLCWYVWYEMIFVCWYGPTLQLEWLSAILKKIHFTLHQTVDCDSKYALNLYHLDDDGVLPEHLTAASSVRSLLLFVYSLSAHWETEFSLPLQLTL